MRTHSIITWSTIHLAFYSQGTSLLENVSYIITIYYYNNYIFFLIIVAVRLTSINQVLLVVGVILLSIATIVLIVVNIKTRIGIYSLVTLRTLHALLYPIFLGSRLFLIMLVVGCVVVVLSIVLWIAVGFQVGLQKSEISKCCDSTLHILLICM